VGQVELRQCLGLIVLNAVNAAEVVFAVRTHAGAGAAVLRTPGIAVGHDRAVEIQHIHGAIRPELHIHRKEPKVLSAQPFAIRHRHVAHDVRGGGAQFLEMDDVQNRLRAIHGAIPLLRPSAGFIDRAGTGGAVPTHHVDLLVRHAGRHIFADHFAMRDDALHAAGGAYFAFAEHPFGEDDVLHRIATGGLSEQDFTLAGNIHAKAIAALGAHLLDGRAIRLEAEHARS